ncbi:ACP S-malonyltransferase [Candidatus Symbiobacter mobilis]|uniref:Malonyl CoA-acyl carrier protein transacylase n=1 Tax=Candidatus Symbiobacter mobilis CR TaxID=946483 RepID=U5N5V3_9BURK|nr:ACP S-malonyltransferase [Candidatus Symbiobacter mobilis]AGX86866.1 [acyl-carrier-protein] S-malonyltransferase [Candidatus Symbiobacter mobilis CR]
MASTSFLPFAFVFPGQGSQSVGMLDGWADHPEVRHVLQEASDALGEDLTTLIRQGPKEALALTVNTQPAMLVADIAAYRVWMAEVGVAPAALAGHSLGEYAALVAGGALSLSDAVRLVRFRAQAMQSAVPAGVGAMAAILGIGGDVVAQVCAEASAESAQPMHPDASQEADARDIVEAVNFNDPMQTVIAGTKDAVDRACAMLKTRGAKRAVLLPVSAPFHSSLMYPAACQLQTRLQETPFTMPQIDVFHNVDAQPHSSAESIREALVKQAYHPVRWVECIHALAGRGVRAIVECGPGKVLTGLTRRIDPSLQALALFDPATLTETRTALSAPASDSMPSSVTSA